ncbi:type II toxin-antitoxin system HicA family toxin [bacterium]|nr:type II toxin-antitoxin system HicA family toxin [bacterium]
MSRLKVVPFNVLRKMIERNGFTWQRCNGSHNVFKHPDGRTISVPDHGSETLKRPLIRRLLRDLSLSIEEYNSQLREI